MSTHLYCKEVAIPKCHIEILPLQTGGRLSEKVKTAPKTGRYLLSYNHLFQVPVDPLSEIEDEISFITGHIYLIIEVKNFQDLKNTNDERAFPAQIQEITICRLFKS